MQLCLLHLDDALARQTAFTASCEARKARQLDVVAAGRHIRLWGRDEKLAPVDAALRAAFFSGAGGDPRLCFMGSGDFHHVSALLLAATLENRARPVTVVHFDNHPDWVHFSGGMHCGSWVNRAAAEKKVSKVISVGICSDDLKDPDGKGANLPLLFGGRLELFPYDHAPSRVPESYGVGRHIQWRTIAQMGEAAFADKLLSRIPTEDVYITLDKDVLSREDCESNWDQGLMRLPGLAALLRAVGRRHKIIGADVTGDYSRPKYAGGAWTRALKKGEHFIDQPRLKVSEQAAANLNGGTNLVLLDIFGDHAMTPAMAALILFCVAAETAYGLCFKRAADGAAPAVLLKRPLVWLGFFLWAVEVAAWVTVLGHVPLSVAFPLMSLVYVATVAGAALVLKEKVSPRRALGALLITAGAACIGVAAQ